MTLCNRDANFVVSHLPEKTARRIIPRRGFPRVECAHGKPWPGGSGNTCGPPINQIQIIVTLLTNSNLSANHANIDGDFTYRLPCTDSDNAPAMNANVGGSVCDEEMAVQVGWPMAWQSFVGLIVRPLANAIANEDGTKTMKRKCQFNLECKCVAHPARCW